MPYQVINLDTDEDHGVYETLSEARGCVRFDKLRAYSIWRGDWEGGFPTIAGAPSWERTGPSEFIGTVRVEWCEPYDGDDDRVKQSLGLPNASEAV